MTATEPKEITIRLDQDTTSIAPDSATIQELDLRVTDRESYARVAAYVVSAKDRIKLIHQWEGFYGTPDEPGTIVSLNAAHKKQTALYAKTCDPYRTVVEAGEAEMKAFVERNRLLEKASQKAIREQEAAQQAAQAATQAEAERLRRAGEIAKAREMGAAPAPVAVAVGPISTPMPTVKGMSTRYPWVAEVEDIKALLRALADGAIPLEYDLKGDGQLRSLVTVDMTVLNSLAKTRQKDLGIPGCVSREDIQYSRSRTR